MSIEIQYLNRLKKTAFSGHFFRNGGDEEQLDGRQILQVLGSVGEVTRTLCLSPAFHSTTSETAQKEAGSPWWLHRVQTCCGITRFFLWLSWCWLLLRTATVCWRKYYTVTVWQVVLLIIYSVADRVGLSCSPLRWNTGVAALLLTQCSCIDVLCL